jgi:hypothetical protein
MQFGYRWAAEVQTSRSPGPIHIPETPPDGIDLTLTIEPIYSSHPAYY